MISVYIHVPFCLRKCNYCGFVSSSVFSNEDIDTYVSALIAEIEIAVSEYHINNKKVATIFFGGGTPSILSPGNLQKIILALHENFDTSELVETSIEVNPASNFDFKALKILGFNRISLGVQSFNNSELRFLGRLHDTEQSERAVEAAQKHFDNVSIDLMYGLPGQTLSTLEYSIRMALELDIQHISAYSLTYEPGTELWQALQGNFIKKIAIDTECDMYKLVCDKLLDAGIFQYEVSNFAKPQFKCLHNLRYWQRKDYIGFGVAAHSLLRNGRYSNKDNLSEYIKKLSEYELPLEELEMLEDWQIAEEEIFLGLRSEGIESSLLNTRQRSFMEDCIKQCYAIELGGRYVLTSAGRFLTDSIVLKLLTM